MEGAEESPLQPPAARLTETQEATEHVWAAEWRELCLHSRLLFALKCVLFFVSFVYSSVHSEIRERVKIGGIVRRLQG